jgi:hypothetical protein
LKEKRRKMKNTEKFNLNGKIFTKGTMTKKLYEE